MSARESVFEGKLVKELEDLFPGAFVLKMFPGYIQGFPDRLILHGDKWAAFEVKRYTLASHQPNQNYYIDVLNKMSYASFVYPKNKEVFLDEIQRALRITRTARLLRR